MGKSEEVFGHWVKRHLFIAVTPREVGENRTNKWIISTIIITWLIISSVSTFVLLHDRPIKFGSTNTQGIDSVDPQIPPTQSQANVNKQPPNLGDITPTEPPRELTDPGTSESVQQTSAHAEESCNKTNDSCKTENDQTLTEDDVTHPLELPVPYPDGRIFLGAGSSEDPIPYIPTENPKAEGRVPIILSDLAG